MSAVYVDAHTYVGHWPFSALGCNDAAGLIRVLDRNRIDRALTAPIQGLLYRDVMPANSELLRQIKPYADRLLPVAVVNPAYPRWRRDFEWLVDSGFRAISVFPDYHGYSACDPQLAELLDRAGEAAIPVQLINRLVDPRGRHALDPGFALSDADIAERIVAHPKTDFIVVGGNGAAIAAQLSQARRAKAAGSESDRPGGEVPPQTVLFDFARLDVFGSDSSFASLLREAGAESVVFGSQAPFQYPEVNRVKMLYADLTPEQRAMVKSGNLNRLLDR